MAITWYRTYAIPSYSCTTISGGLLPTIDEKPQASTCRSLGSVKESCQGGFFYPAMFQFCHQDVFLTGDFNLGAWICLLTCSVRVHPIVYRHFLAIEHCPQQGRRYANGNCTKMFFIVYIFFQMLFISWVYIFHIKIFIDLLIMNLFFLWWIHYENDGLFLKRFPLSRFYSRS